LRKISRHLFKLLILLTMELVAVRFILARYRNYL